MAAISEICACPIVKCPNHGDCAKCVSRHLRRGYLNYCSMHTMLPIIRKVCEASPDSETARQLMEHFNSKLDAYQKHMDANGISKEDNAALLKKVTEYSDY